MAETSIPQKACKTCKRLKPCTIEYYRQQGIWFENECRECCNERSKLARRTPTTKPQQRAKDGYKVCSVCEERKPYTIEYFHKRENGRLTSHCKLCRNVHGSAYNKGRAAENALYMRLWRLKNPERHKRNTRNYYYKTREKRIASVLKYQHAHPEVGRVFASLHRAREIAAGGSYSVADVLLQYRTQKGLCWWCGKSVNNIYHVDHRVPLSRGGRNDARNICIACPSCNWSKGAKMPYEWNGRLL